MAGDGVLGNWISKWGALNHTPITPAVPIPSQRDGIGTAGVIGEWLRAPHLEIHFPRTPSPATACTITITLQYVTVHATKTQ